MRVQGQRGLHADKETLDVEGLKHDFGDLLSVLGSVVWRLGQDEAVLIRLTAQVLVDALVPILFNAFPVADLTRPEDVSDIVGVRALVSLIANKIVQIWVSKRLLVQCF